MYLFSLMIFDDFWIAIFISFHNMHVYWGLWNLWAASLIIFEVMTDVAKYTHILNFHFIGAEWKTQHLWCAGKKYKSTMGPKKDSNSNACFALMTQQESQLVGIIPRSSPWCSWSTWKVEERALLFCKWGGWYTDHFNNFNNLVVAWDHVIHEHP